MSESSVCEKLDLSFIQKTLENEHTDGNVKIMNYDVSVATKGGDEGYTSDVLRIKVGYKIDGGDLKFSSFIAKFILESSAMNKIKMQYDFFNKELEMYTRIGPKLSSLSGETFMPKYNFHMREPSQIILTEDLIASGFLLKDRRLCLDLDHCNCVLNKLGKFHAASMILAHKEPGILDKFDGGFFPPRSQMTKDRYVYDLFQGGLKYLIEVVSEWEGFEKVPAKLERIQDNMIDAFYSCLNHPKTKVKCLNHGDLWTNNFLFKYDLDGKPIDLRLIDFQVFYYSSVAIDLNYFLYTSPKNEVRESHWDEMIDVYCSSLFDTLRAHNYQDSKMPTFTDIQDELKLYEFYGFLASVGILPLVLMDRVDGLQSNLESLEDEKTREILKKVQMTGDLYLEAIKPILLKFEQHGVLDVFDKN